MRRLVAAVVAVVLVAGLLVVGGRRLMNHTSFQVAGTLVHRVETTDRVVALTFDDGPTDGDSDAVLDVLAQHRVPATFYLVGESVAARPDLARRIVADGHELGNHTWTHRRMVLLTPGEAAHEIETTDAVLREVGHQGEPTFRPPYGKKLVVTPAYLAAHDRVTVMWDVSCERFDGVPQSAQEIADCTVAATRPGSIILLHPWNGRHEVQQALVPIIERLTADGYTFVTVSDLLAR